MPSDPTELSEEALRQALDAVFADLSALPAGPGPERAALLERKAALVRALRKLEIPGADEISGQWNERAASKPASDRGRPYIASHGEGGESGG